MNSFDGLWNKEWQEPKLGDARGTPKIIKDTKNSKLGDAPEGTPSFRPLPSVTLLGAIFLFTNMICVLLGASCIICVFVC